MAGIAKNEQKCLIVIVVPRNGIMVPRNCYHDRKDHDYCQINMTET